MAFASVESQQMFADRQSQKAIRCIKKRQYRCAIRHFQQAAFHLKQVVQQAPVDKRPTLEANYHYALYVLARVYQADKQLRRAYTLYKQCVESGKASPQVQNKARQKLASLQTTITIQTPSVQGAIARLTYDNKTSAHAIPTTRTLPPGALVITITHPSYQTHIKRLTLRPKQVLTYAPKLVPKPIPKTTPPVGAWLLLGTGAACLLGGIPMVIVGPLALQNAASQQQLPFTQITLQMRLDRDTSNQQIAEEFRFGQGMTIGGIALLATGIGLSVTGIALLASPSTQSKSSKQSSVVVR